MRYQKVFFVAVALTGTLLIVFLSQLTRANPTWGAGEGRSGAASTPAPAARLQVTTIARATPTLAMSTTEPTRIVPRETATSAPVAEPTERVLIATPTLIAADGTLFHTVKAGETLVQIAEMYDSTTQAIIARNQLPRSGAVDPGQLLVIPVFSTPPATSAAVVTVNGLPADTFIIMPPEVKEHVRTIYARGMDSGREPNSFAVIGDSTVEMLNFLTGFETMRYDLGAFAYLQPVLTHYAGSFSRPRYAVEQGIHSRQVFLDTYADPEACEDGESMIDCEWRLHDPSIVIIRIGSNDGNPELFDNEVRRMVSYALEKGTIPIIGTKADEYLDPGYGNNQLLRQIARDYLLPLWDFQLVAQTLPDNGLLYDRVHLTLFPEFDWTMPDAFRTGHGLQNLTALMALDAVMRAIAEEQVR